jgi:hypothetical protein
VLGRDISYFVKKVNSDSTKKFSETDIINMLEFLIDNIFVIFGVCVSFVSTLAIPFYETQLDQVPGNFLKFERKTYLMLDSYQYRNKSLESTLHILV